MEKLKVHPHSPQRVERKPVYHIQDVVSMGMSPQMKGVVVLVLAG
ncbi:MAG: hypothetical protein SPF62_06255 [Prevotella sp.]|nr:hypothetical protein [Prevotella sp.]MDY5546913.1 hypothetical protein [Prevotella sp.]